MSEDNRFSLEMMRLPILSHLYNEKLVRGVGLADTRLPKNILN